MSCFPSFLFAFLLCYDLHAVAADWDLFGRLFLPVLLVKLLVFWRMGLGHGWWRYVSIPDVVTLFFANLGASAIVLLYVVFIHGIEGVPRSLILLDAMICFLLSCVSVS